MALLTLSRGAVAALIGLGFASLHLFGESNTLFPTIVEHRDKHLLPTHNTWTTKSFPTSFTGYDSPDSLLSTLLVFFWPIVDGENPAASLIGFVFGAQGVAFWTVMVLEGLRNMNSGRVVSFTTAWGLLIQVVGLAVIGPVYLTLYLFTSPLIISAKALTPSDLAIPEGLLTGIPFGTIIGLILPTVLMSLPAPSMLSVSSKITAILVWQPFPLWVTVYTFIWKAVFWPTITYQSEADALANQLPLLRHVYKFALAISVPAHLATMTLSLCAGVFCPGMFTVFAQSELNPLSVFIPPNPFSDTKAATVAEGAKWFLQYDYSIFATAFLIWALASRYAKPVAGASHGDSNSIGIGTVLDLVGRVALLGPFATALTLIWDRDEAVFAGASAVSAKKSA
ncbi:uncharacterized protein A1O9_07142 [Exophiala aquamarina CBS 119918]|uniref:Uncharacterized protein n=1 Tax=Exophiala aquamarina CBS 119918 TaxID=1182545 RepID=A0A072PB10_9EURO|nr:uncharacterized protein A1O9_07142 [Exophiala aquamarina CBS 119918]KEF56952.1 hypothetical protein A1O9_07142 [Exophiala aquamarina CBS 119918]